MDKFISLRDVLEQDANLAEPTKPADAGSAGSASSAGSAGPASGKQMPSSRYDYDALARAGRKGGKTWQASLTPEQRSENARKAALAMHAKRREAHEQRSRRKRLGFIDFQHD